MRILYFASVDFYQKPNPSLHLMTTMLHDLLENGISIDYVGCAIEGIEKHIPDEFLINKDFHYQLVELPNTPKSSFAKRYFDGITYARKAKKLIKRVINDCDIIFVQSSPTVLYNIRAVRSLDKKKTIVYNIQDMFPGSSIASGVMPNKLMQSIFYSLQRSAYKNSNIMVVISEDMKTKLMEQGVPQDKIRVIVNWFDDTSVHEVSWDENRFVEKYKMEKDKFYVQYAGTMGYVFDYKMVLNVAKLLQKYKDIEIQMIGEGSQKEVFISEAEVEGIDNIVFLPLEPQNMVSDVYSACSVCFIPLKKGIIGNSVPSKAGLLMACKRPIVTTSDEGSDYNDMINSNNIGFAYSTDSPDKVAESLVYLKNNPDEARQMGENGFEFGHDLYSRTSNMNLYLDLFLELFERGK